MRRSVPLSRLEGWLDTDRGLSAAEASERRDRYGCNDIIETPPGRWRELIRETAGDPMIWFLVGTSALFTFLRDYAEALTLLIATVPLIAMDAFLHRRTQASTAGLKTRLASRARVVRDGATVTIPALDLVPGDLAMVAAAESFPADGILLQGEALQADESVLTGEAYPVRKQPLASIRPGDSEVGVNAMHWGFAGTRLLTGQALLRIVYTGGETLYGEIVRSALHGARGRTPLQHAITRLVKVLVVAAALMCLILAWIRLQQGYGPVDAVLSAVTLAVAALPEEFPVAFTFFLGVGIYRLAKQQALVQRAVVVENIGRVSCICSDKTGTITEGQIRLAHYYPAAGLSTQALLTLAALASRRDSGDPLDVTILEATSTNATVKRIATFPFTEDRKRETAMVQVHPRTLLAAVKGAPEVVLGLSTLAAEEQAAWQEHITALAATGHKVIACAWREVDKAAWSGNEPEQGLTFAGLLACEDPVRKGVSEAVRACQEADIHVLMVTGDHPATARAVAREIGLGDGEPRVIEAAELGTHLSREEGQFLRSVDVIARAIPAQKLTLVQALQSAGEIVAVTGDGVNDVPALQAADIGIAMGERGTRSAREIASIVLLDDNFRTIVRAIAQGRQLFHNLQLSFAYLLMIHIPLVVTAALVPLAGYPLLYLPIHIVWLELIIHPTALLVFQELPTSDRLRRIQHDPRLRFFSPQEWLIIGLVGLLVTAVVAGGYERSLGLGHDVEHARAMALVALTVASAMLTASLTDLRTWAARLMVLGTVGTTWLFVQTPMLAARLHLTPLHLDDWVAAVAGSLLAAGLAVLIRLGRRS